MKVLYADSALLVLDKPAGLLSVPGRGADKQDCLSARAQAAYPDALIVHRLDMATSGLMLMARDSSSQRRLSQAFASREVTKRYVAVVSGQMTLPSGDWGVIDLPIIVDWPNRPRRIIDAQTGKPSVTRWQLASLEQGSRSAVHSDPYAATKVTDQFDVCAPFSRIMLEPITGRSHQLRVHLAAVGHPILGDSLYAPAQDQARASRLLLHACSLCFAHPVSGERVQFTSSIPF